ncbi:MAG: uracil-DNA glycosylase [Verrucomicrobiae bacterium]|nr:uracil-DNA glycosylase [Verrucomicrobiae bacterium]
MSSFQEALDATIGYLESLKRAGVTHVAVRRETLEALDRPVAPPAARAASSAPYAIRHTSPAAAPQPASIAVPAPCAEVQDMFAERIRYTGATKAEKMASLREQALVCAKCKHLAASRTQVVFGVGNPETELMFVGEAPGADEDAQGEPFVGRAGQLLTKIIQTMGFNRADVYIGNVLKCRPDTPGAQSGNRAPTDAEMKTCLPWLQAQIEIIQPKVIVALGAVALRGLIPELSAGITRLRGNWLLYRGVPLMPTYHPAYVLRAYTLENRRAIWEDMLKVLEKLGRPITPKMRNYFKSA